MLLFAYRLLTWLAIPVALVYHWYRSVSRGRKSAFAERLGWLPSDLRSTFREKSVIWLQKRPLTRQPKPPVWPKKP